MKIISLTTKNIYDIDFTKTGYIKCPECLENRKKKNTKPFRVNSELTGGYCYHCNTSFVEYKPFKSEKTYIVPEWKNITKLSDKAVKYFTSRMISQQTLNKLKIYTDIEFMPQHNKELEVICFPYFYNEKLKNIKFRGAEKSFKMVSGAELVFYNLDNAIKYDSIIIVEGEIDCLSLVEIGIENCVSVPNGASAKDMPFIDNYVELFKNKKIILAVDNDLPGTELKGELIRRFGAENCLIVSFEDCKDANEVLCKKGGLELRQLIENASEIPISGIVDITSKYDEIYNLFINGLEKGVTIGIDEIDNLITWELGRLAVWTGIPSHGKSSICDLVNVLLNVRYGWKVAYFSPESYPIKYHYARVYSLLTGCPFKANGNNEKEFESVFNYIEQNYSFIYPEDNFKFETILEKAQYLVKTRGINILTIDPYNNLEHTKNKGENDTDYVGRVLYELTKFGKKNNCLIQLIVHPTKMKKQLNGKYEKPNMYDINGSANFYNKPDYGISVYRHFDDNPRIEIDVLKVKWKHLGDGGNAEFRYNYNNGRLENINKTIDSWNNKSYLETAIIPQIEPLKTDEDFWYNKDNEFIEPAF